MKSNDRIINGQSAPKAIPWQVSLHKYLDRYHAQHWCGASIIDHNTIITAAHCFTVNVSNVMYQDYSQEKYEIVVGLLNQRSSSMKKFAVKEIIGHPNYVEKVKGKICVP